MNYNRSQADKIGNIRLDVIRNELEDSILEAEKTFSILPWARNS